MQKNYSLSDLNEHLSALPKEENFYIHCASGYRSVIAASILKKRGIHNFADVINGFKDLKETELGVEETACTLSKS